MNEYRILTEEEHEKLLGEYWRENYPQGWDEDMDQYLGRDLPQEYNNECEENEIIFIDRWWFSRNSYTLKEQLFKNGVKTIKNGLLTTHT